MSDLQGKVALITGGNSGIGLATAIEFHKQGAKVAISGRNASALEEAKKQLGQDVLAVQSDVTKLEDIDSLLTTIRNTFGGIDILFMNAGTAKLGPIEAVTEEIFDIVMNTNFKGMYFTIQKALPFLNDQASIILNGSVNALVGFANSSVYSASKAAVHSLARTLAPELISRGIRVNTLAIGPIDTPLYSKLDLQPEEVQGFAELVVRRLPIKRFGRTEEIAKAALFLASADSSFVVGSEITIDGGLAINTL